MRLLKRSSEDGFVLTKDLAGDDEIPPYAILSHTWEDEQEVTFNNLKNGTGKSKTGYAKIRFCGEQAERDGLQYFWVDTCCINKADHAELQDAINSMFRWYQNAAKCYVYLSDVSAVEEEPSDGASKFAWESAFRAARWFTRGWTLQELLAPSCVEFFSQEQKKLGDKQVLRQQIHKITGIPIPALQGAPLSQFSANERLSWKNNRHTEIEEDRAYSLLGIFGVYLAPIYGEGIGGAFKRLLDEITKQEKCIQDLRLTDPRDDKKRIEETKGGLLEDSYRWILDNTDFQQWHGGEQGQLLWIKGDPGKGKTMLLCGIINELKKSVATTDVLSYFFCQATDSRINKATAVLRGLLYMLVNQQPSLVSHVRKKYDQAGKALFEDANAWVALSEIFANMLQDPSLNTTYLIIDALDECVLELPKLLDFVAQQSSTSSRVKWIVSSRNWPVIEERLADAGHRVRLSLELNAESVSTAVNVFIQHKVLQLAQKKGYDDKVQQAVQRHLSANANGTFLWVALVCQSLDSIPRWRAVAALNAFPPGLNSLYRQMMDQISNSGDADLCNRILAAIAIVYRPITVTELTSLVEMLEDMADDIESIHEIIGLCGSFLTVREGVIYFVHQSAKDFLLEQAFSKIFPSGREAAHHTVFSKSLQVLSQTLRRDMYSLRAVGYPIEQVEQPDPDPLGTSRYSCVYWIDHLYDWSPDSATTHLLDLQDGGIIDVFLRKKYLHWLEALSLSKSMSKGVVSMAKLVTLIHNQGHASTLLQLAQDARRFIMYHKVAVENAPLQAYVSALVFSPTRSLIRNLFRKEEPRWLTIKPPIMDEWSPCLQTLEGHSRSVKSVTFSHDSTRVASASDDSTVKIWDVESGACVQTLTGHSGWVNSVTFSHDSTRVASASDDSTVKIWDVESGACVQTLTGHSRSVKSVTFSHDSTRVASASYDSTVKIWDVESGACVQTLTGHSGSVNSVTFSHDSTVKIWDVESGACVQTLTGHSGWVNSVTFSHDSTRVASASDDSTVKVWDVESGACVQTLQTGRPLYNITFDATGCRLHTETGAININASLFLNTTAPLTQPQQPQFYGAALSSDWRWITYNSENLLWLPPEYGPSCSTVLGKNIGIGVGSGKVWICSIKLPEF